MFKNIKVMVSEFLNDERGTDLPVTAIMAAMLGVGAVGAVVYLIGKVKTTTNTAGSSLDDAATQEY